MASIIFGAAGSALGASIGGSVLGVSASTIGQVVGSAAGAVVDRLIANALSPKQIQRAPGIDQIGFAAPREGEPLARVHGWARVDGRIIWPSEPNFRVVTTTTEQSSGASKGFGGGRSTTETQTAFVDVAVAMCTEIDFVQTAFADGNPFDLSTVNHEIYYGTSTQDPDPTMEAAEGSGNVPNYRGIAYIVFRDLDVTQFGNRVPQFHFVVYKGPDASLMPQGSHLGVNVIPGSTEYGYDPLVVRQASVDSSGAVVRSTVENSFLSAAHSDFSLAMDHMQAEQKKLEQVSLVIAWFGTDLRCGVCRVEPRVDLKSKSLTTGFDWLVSNMTRGAATRVTLVDGIPAYGGAPNDASVIRAIRDLKARGYRVTIHPFIVMDVEQGNTLPNPYDGSTGQPPYPWRGRITCDPAPGEAGTVDKTAAARTQINAFFGSATAAEFGGSGQQVTYTGADGYTLRRFILHCAHLASRAGGVDSFLLGSEMIGLTRLRDEAGAFPAVEQYVSLAAEVATILPSARIGYGADWTEYGAYAPSDGSNDVVFPLDDLWADLNIDFIGIDAYFPLTDWRGTTDQLDNYASIYDPNYIRGGIEGGEAYTYFYASDADRVAQVRTPIDDTAHGEHWVFRQKDIRNWHGSAHHPRPGGVRSATPTAWVPSSKPIVFTEYGFPAVDKGPNQPNVFVDPKSSESELPHFSTGARDDDIQRIANEVWVSYWLNESFVDSSRSCVWAFDARPWPVFARTDVFADAENWTTGHWISGRPAVTLDRLVREEAAYFGISDLIEAENLLGAVEGVTFDQLGGFRDAIEPYAKAFFADFVAVGGKIRGRSRGLSGEQTGPTRLDLIDTRDGNVYVRDLGAVSGVPARANISARDAMQDFDSETRPASIGLNGATGELAFNLPAVTDPQLLAPIGSAQLVDANAARHQISFALPLTWYHATVPGTVLKVDFGQGEELILVQRRTVGDQIQVEGRRYDPAIRTQLRHPRLGLSLTAPEIPGDVIPVFLDLPLLSEDQSDQVGFLAAHVEPDRQLAVYRSSSQDTGYLRVSTLAQSSAIGETVTDLGAGQPGLWQTASLDVRLFTGSLVTRTEVDVLSGSNALAIKSGAGWEILGFVEAEMIGPEIWRISRFSRGQRGTPSDAVAAGARIVLLNAAVGTAGLASADVGVPYFWSIGPATVDRSDPSYVTGSHTFLGKGRIPFKPVHLRAERVAGDLVVNWVRQDRDPRADIWDGEIPMSEAELLFRVEVSDGGPVLLTKDVTAEMVTISSAEEATAGVTLPYQLSVSQVSQSAGAGASTEITITV